MAFLSVLIAMSLSVDIARCNLRVFPQNAAVIAGQVMTMECGIHNGTVVREWMLLRSCRSEKNELHLDNDRIFSNWDNEPRSTHLAEFWVDVDQYGSGTLYSNYTKLEDAGLYTCVVESGYELIRWSAHLIVLESTPFCNTNLNTSSGDSLVDGTRIWMRCSVKFRGYWVPSMEWRHHTDDKVGQIVTADEVVENENVVITSTISIIFNSSINGSIFSCKIYFSTQQQRCHANATNVPNYSHVWKSLEITKTPSVNSASLTTAPLDKNSNSSTNVYFVSLTAVGVMATFFFLVTTVQCLRMKITSSAKVVKIPLDEVDGPISSGQRAVSSPESMYENIDDEAITTMQTGQGIDDLSEHRSDSRTPFSSDSKCISPDQQIPAIDKGYENARTRRGNQPVNEALTLPTLDAECQSTGEDQPDLYSEIPQDNSRVESVSYTRMVAQVRKPAPYESLQPFSTSKPI